MTATAAGPARGVRAQLARTFVGTISRVENPTVRLIGLQQAEGFIPPGEQGVALLHELAEHPGWPARALAARLLGERTAQLPLEEQEAAWETLARLARDPERWVREASSSGFGALLRANPGQWGTHFLAAFDSVAEPMEDDALKHALLFGVVPAIRRGPPEAEAIAVEAIDRAARDDSPATRQLGALVVGRELAVALPEHALRLVEKWADGNDAEQWQAARSLTKALREAFPEQTAQIVSRLEASPSAAVRNALRGALRDEPESRQGDPALRAPLPLDPLATLVSLRPTQRGRAPGPPAADAAGPPSDPPSNWSSTADIPTSTRTIDQVIGQSRAVDIVRLAARQKRFVLLVGEPGTGKSMLGAAMAEMMGAHELEDVLVVPNPESRINPQIQVIPTPDGEAIIRDAKRKRGEAESAITYLFWAATAAVSIVAGWYAYRTQSAIPTLIGAVVFFALLLARRFFRSTSRLAVPKLLVNNARALEADRAPFVDATGFHAGALLGDVRHDPFQSGGYETPPHELVEAGAIHLAHRGVLFIDEVSTLSVESQQSLLTAIQEKRFPISGRTLGSSGTMMRSTAAPCDFLLMLAGNMQDVEKMHPALRSRVRGYGYEIYMNEDMPDTPETRLQLARFCAQEVLKDRKIPHLSRAAVEAIVDEARVRSGKPDRLTTRLRELGGLIRAAGDLAVQAGDALVEPHHVSAARENTRTLEEQMAARRRPAA